MEPSFLLEGVAHPDRFLPPKYRYHCTQMAIRQLERLNGGYRPVYAQRDPILPQTGKLAGVHQTLYNANSPNIDIADDAEPCIDDGLNSGALQDNDRVSNCTDFSDGFLNTGNISILASSLDGEDIWSSRGSNDSIDVLSVTGSIIQYDPNSSADQNMSDDSIPSPFLQMSCIQLKDLDNMQSSVYSSPQESSVPSNDVSLPGISIHSNPSISYSTPRIIPTSVDFSGAETGCLRVSELEHTVGCAPDFSLSYDNLLAKSKATIPIQACCISVLSKALRKKLPSDIVFNPLTPRCIHLKDKEPAALNLPPVLKLLQQKVRYCGHVKTVLPAQVPGNHIDCVPQLRQRTMLEQASTLPYLAGHTKPHGKAGPSLSKQTIAGEVFTLPKLKRGYC